jgi:sugar phosphate isomerase/epimerase
VLWAASTCGADHAAKDWKTLIRPLDEGTFDQVAFLRLLQDAGFSGPVGLQCCNVSLSPEQNLRRALKAWNGFLEDL